MQKYPPPKAEYTQQLIPDVRYFEYLTSNITYFCADVAAAAKPALASATLAALPHAAYVAVVASAAALAAA